MQVELRTDGGELINRQYVHENNIPLTLTYKGLVVGKLKTTDKQLDTEN